MTILDIILGAKAAQAYVVVEAAVVVVGVSVVAGYFLGIFGVTGVPFIAINTLWIFTSIGYYFSIYYSRGS